MVISASTGKLLNFTEMPQNVLPKSYLVSFLRMRFSPSSLLKQKDPAKMYPDVAAVSGGLSHPASAVLESPYLSTDYKLSS